MFARLGNDQIQPCWQWVDNGEPLFSHWNHPDFLLCFRECPAAHSCICAWMHPLFASQILWDSHQCFCFLVGVREAGHREYRHKRVNIPSLHPHRTNWFVQHLLDYNLGSHHSTVSSLPPSWLLGSIPHPHTNMQGSMLPFVGTQCSCSLWCGSVSWDGVSDNTVYHISGNSVCTQMTVLPILHTSLPSPHPHCMSWLKSEWPEFSFQEWFLSA